MKIRWRQHELMMAGFITTFFILGTISRDVNLTPELNFDLYEMPFKERHFKFNYFQHILIPDILLALVLFLSLFYLNAYIIGRLLLKRKNALVIVHAGLLFAFLSMGLAISNYLFQQYLYYSPTHSNRSLLRLFVESCFMAGRMLALYSIYAFLREWVIHYFEKTRKGRTYRIMIMNRITAAAAIYFSVFAFAAFFQLLTARFYFTAYAFFAPALLITYFMTLYWFFPMKGSQGFFSKKVVIRFLFMMLGISIPIGFAFVILMSEPNKIFPFILICSTTQLCVYALAALQYSQQKEKIEAMRGLETELEKSEAGLQFLRSQINPHFLFNALNTIYGMALQENAERTAEGVQQLGDMMRFMLHENSQDSIALRKEVDYLKNYISLQKLRTQSSPNIKIDTDIVASDGNHVIAPMLLIPFVENAFKHGISLERPSFIKIVLRQKANTLFFDVHNSIHHSIGHDAEKFKSGIGLQNVKQRLDLLYPARHELIIHESAAEFFIHLTIQLA